MKKWILKAVIQKTISFLPSKMAHSFNYWFQKNITKGVHLTDGYLVDKLIHVRYHFTAYNKISNKPPNNCLELGTGWYPVIPIALFLSGANTINTVDISPLMDSENLKTTLLMFKQYKENNKLEQYFSINKSRYGELENLVVEFENKTFGEQLSALNINYLVEDARKLSLENGSVDFITSNNVFEHIYPQILKPIMQEFRRVLKPETGFMSHFIDMSDHFAHMDKNITIYNFLQFSESQWKQIDNSIQPQSRLRIDDYELLYAETDFLINDKDVRNGNIDEVKSLKLYKTFADKPIETVAVSHCYLVSYA